jgi:hypothetical protein
MDGWMGGGRVCYDRRAMNGILHVLGRPAFLYNPVSGVVVNGCGLSRGFGLGPEGSRRPKGRDVLTSSFEVSGLEDDGDSDNSSVLNVGSGKGMGCVLGRFWRCGGFAGGGCGMGRDGGERASSHGALNCIGGFFRLFLTYWLLLVNLQKGNLWQWYDFSYS